MHAVQEFVRWLTWCAHTDTPGCTPGCTPVSSDGSLRLLHTFQWQSRKAGQGLYLQYTQGMVYVHSHRYKDTYTQGKAQGDFT